MGKMRGMREKIIFTIMIIILFRLGSILPVPFINTDLLRASMESASGTLFDLFNMMSGGGLTSASVFAMGVSPYINASIIVQLLTVALPILENMKKEGTEGSKKLNKINRYVAFGLALAQSYSFLYDAESMGCCYHIWHSTCQHYHACFYCWFISCHVAGGACNRKGDWEWNFHYPCGRHCVRSPGWDCDAQLD